MHLLDSELRNKEEWEAAGIELPKFDREAMKAATRECPRISGSMSAEAAERWC